MEKIKSFIIKNKFIIGGIVIAVVILIAAFLSGGSLDKNTDKVSSANSNISSYDEAATADSVLYEDKNEPEDEKTNSDNTTATSEDKSSSSSNVSNETSSTEEKNASVEGENSSDNASNSNSNSNSSSSESSFSGTQSNSSSSNSSSSKRTEKDKYLTDPVPDGKPEPIEPEDQIKGDKKLTCTFSISCATILDNIDDLDPDKVEVVPEDGWILKPTKVTFNEGESVYEVLQRICKENNIQMEYSWTPIYNSVYIEGIHNLYEFDCGSLSGWMYSVNNWFPNYGCSRYVLQDGDVVEWKYTCDLGYDVGGGYAVGG